MTTEAKRRRSLSPPATIHSSSSSSPKPVANGSSPYFLPELIPLIASRLTSLQDFFALRAACRTYRALLPPSPSNLASQAPHLLVPHMASASEALFHLHLRRILRFRLPRTHLTAHDSTLTDFHSFGCRVAIYDDMASPSRRVLRIVHLLTGERVRLPDPPKHFYRVLLSGDLVLAFRPRDRVVQYCRLGDAHWRVASCGEAYLLEDLIFVKGTLYALVTPGYRLAVVELSDNNSVELAFLGGELGAQTVQESSFFCLAECRSELLLISGVEFFPRVYHVFRWQIREGKWMRATSLGGCTLFFADYHFAGCLGPDHPGIRRDCMYFTEDVAGKWSEYSLVDGSFDEFVADYPGEAVTGDYDAPVWILPSIC